MNLVEGNFSKTRVQGHWLISLKVQEAECNLLAVLKKVNGLSHLVPVLADPVTRDRGVIKVVQRYHTHDEVGGNQDAHNQSDSTTAYSPMACLAIVVEHHLRSK